MKEAQFGRCHSGVTLLEVQVRPRHLISSGLLGMVNLSSHQVRFRHSRSYSQQFHRAPFALEFIIALRIASLYRLFLPPVLIPTSNKYLYFLHFNRQIVFRYSNYITPPFFESPKQIPTLRLVRPVHYIPSLISLSPVLILKCRAITTHIHRSFITALLYSQFLTS